MDKCATFQFKPLWAVCNFPNEYNNNEQYIVGMFSNQWTFVGSQLPYFMAKKSKHINSRKLFTVHCDCLENFCFLPKFYDEITSTRKQSKAKHLPSRFLWQFFPQFLPKKCLSSLDLLRLLNLIAKNVSLMSFCWAFCYDSPTEIWTIFSTYLQFIKSHIWSSKIRRNRENMFIKR